MSAGDLLSTHDRQAIQAAKMQFGQTLLQLVGRDDAMRLAVQGYAEAFVDVLIASAGSGAGAALVKVANTSLRRSGYQLAPVRR